MVLPLPAEEEPELEELDARLARIEDALLALAGMVGDISERFGGIEELLERYAPLLAMAEARMQGGRLGSMRRGAARVNQNRNPQG